MAFPLSPPSTFRIEGLPAVSARVGFCRSWNYAAVARGSFPTSLKIARASGWDSRAIDAWIDAQARRSQAGPNQS